MKQLDCMGLVCPEPVIRCRKLLQEESPAELVVLVDNEAAVENLTRFLKKSGYTVASSQEGPRQWSLQAQRAAEVPVSEENPACAVPVASSRVSKSLLLIMSQTMGTGDDVLGSALMGNFLGAFKELADTLWCVVLINGGVKLACEEGKPLQALRELQAEGVQIEVCGNCLNHYGILDRLGVGQVTNMLDIVTKLGEADKVIRI